MKSEVVTQLLYGDTFKKLKKNRIWVKIKNDKDNYTGFIKDKKFKPNQENTHCNLSLLRINHSNIKEGITMTVVITKNIPQSPFNQSTNSPEEAANVVRPRVPIEASNAYCVAV